MDDNFQVLKVSEGMCTVQVGAYAVHVMHTCIYRYMYSKYLYITYAYHVVHFNSIVYVYMLYTLQFDLLDMCYYYCEHVPYIYLQTP